MTKKETTIRIIKAFIVITISISMIFGSIGLSNGLSQTKIGILTNEDTVNVGETFDVIIYIDPDETIGGWLLNISFTPNLIQANNVSPGSIWEELFDVGGINNDQGFINGIQTWKKEEYPETNHTACIISFIALSSGVCDIFVDDAVITNSLFNDINYSLYPARIVIVGDDPTEFPIGDDDNPSDDGGNDNNDDDEEVYVPDENESISDTGNEDDDNMNDTQEPSDNEIFDIFNNSGNDDLLEYGLTTQESENPFGISVLVPIFIGIIFIIIIVVVGYSRRKK